MKTIKATLVFGCLLGFTAAAYPAEVIVRVAPPPPTSVVVVGHAPGPGAILSGFRLRAICH